MGAKKEKGMKSKMDQHFQNTRAAAATPSQTLRFDRRFGTPLPTARIRYNLNAHHTLDQEVEEIRDPHERCAFLHA